MMRSPLMSALRSNNNRSASMMMLVKVQQRGFYDQLGLSDKTTEVVEAGKKDLQAKQGEVQLW